jgi:hypothetical protein
VFSIDGGVSSAVHRVCSPFRGVRSKWWDDTVNVQGKAAVTDSGRRKIRSVRACVLDILCVFFR